MKIWVNCSVCHHSERLDVRSLDMEIACSQCKHSVTLPDEVEIVEIETGYKKSTVWDIMTFTCLAAGVVFLIIWQIAHQENPLMGSDAETWMYCTIGAGVFSFAFAMVGMFKSREVWY